MVHTLPIMWWLIFIFVKSHPIHWCLLSINSELSSLDFRHFASGPLNRRTKGHMCLSHKQVFGKHFSALRNAYSNAAPNLHSSEKYLQLYGVKYKNVVYFYFKKHFRLILTSWAVGLSEIHLSSETCSVFINTSPVRLNIFVTHLIY